MSAFTDGEIPAAPEKPRRLFVYNGGFLTQPRLRRILDLAGYRIKLGRPSDGDMIGVWGNSPTAHRGLSVAERRDVAVLRVEDAFLRSLHPARQSSEPPIGLTLDRKGAHFDPSKPSDLENMLATHPLDDTALLNRARACIARIQDAHLSKYSAYEIGAPLDPGYVLVIDQTKGDASVTASGADKNRFLEMLFVAQEEHPGKRILIKTHPETAQGLRDGHFDGMQHPDHIEFISDPISPWTLFEGAIGIYTVSSNLGFEAIFAGHKPRVFGQPFYAGWGLTQDEFPIQRRQRTLTRAQMFAAAMILYPTWYDPCRDALCDLEAVIDQLDAQARAWRDDHAGWTASKMSLWKRGALQKVFGQQTPMIFEDDAESAALHAKPWMVWASKATDAFDGAWRVEDGFLRSSGLGAELVPPLSLVLDDLGIYYDPATPSRLEKWIETRASLRPDQEARTERLRAQILKSNLSKYNLRGAMPDLPADKQIILVPGQVEDDASIKTGAGFIKTNEALLKAARAARPDAFVIYKPHPDVEAGLRDGDIDASPLADLVAVKSDAMALLGHADELWTITSLMGFEALLRGVPVVTVGAPFYAGWGLTQDLGDVPPRRRANPSLNGLIHATLIDYPRYIDPVTGLPCPVEVVAERLATGQGLRRGPANRTLSKAQGLAASYAPLWRR
jgi:capsular polysaccharide export protein